MKNTETAFHWIIDILEKAQIPFRITGGCAARIYGAQRELADIDIDIIDDDFGKIMSDIQPYIWYGPQRYQDDQWDLILCSLNYQGQTIDLCDVAHAKIFDHHQRQWVPEFDPAFQESEMHELFHRMVPVISKKYLIAYKQETDRTVDEHDIGELIGAD